MKPATLRDQLLCVVTPIGAGRTERELADRLRACSGALDALFHAHGAIHFATFTILPPRPQEARGSALALTLAIDAGAEPGEALDRLASLDPDTLQAIYQVAIPAGATLRQALGGFLRDPAYRQALTGGFIGTRDRSVAQIRAEGRLARHLRQRLAAVQRPAAPDGRELAAALAADTLADPRFSWARQPAPQGPWRAQVTPAWLRLGASAGWLVGIAWCMLVVGALALIGFGNRLVVARLNGWIGIPDTSLTVAGVIGEGGPVGIALRAAALALLAVNGLVAFAVRRRRLPLFVLQFVLLASVLLVLVILPGVALLAVSDLGAAVPSDLRFARAHLVYGTWVVAGLLAFAGIVAGSGLLAVAIVPPYLAAGWVWSVGVAIWGFCMFLLHFVLAGLVFLSDRFQWLGRQWFQAADPWGWQPIDRIAIVVVLFAVLAYLAVRAALAALRYFGEQLDLLNVAAPEPPANRRLHQTAPSITACEADWVDRISVMVSLTEIRKPYWVNAVAARFFLWMISSLGWHFYSEGRLGSVRAIHYAHWHVIDNGRRLLFCSNYDGDFGGYLDQFILGSVPLLNVIWRWTCLGERPTLQLGGPAFDAVGTRPGRFPPTRMLVFVGCRREQQFKAYARESMLPFQYHYAAYDFPVVDILRSTQLRDALSAERVPANDALVMRALEV